MATFLPGISLFFSEFARHYAQRLNKYNIIYHSDQEIEMPCKRKHKIHTYEFDCNNQIRIFGLV